MVYNHRNMGQYSFKPADSIGHFQKFIEQVYAIPDDRQYSLWDLLDQEQRFAMRALKGIRKNDAEKLKLNLLISFSWMMAIANRLHIDIENEVWKRFPSLCSYCGQKPCACKTIKAAERFAVHNSDALKPADLAGFQQMFEGIYPTANRTVPEAGVHLAEESGEVSEAIHSFLGEHKAEQFDEVRTEIADFVSCIFGLANSAHIDLAQELSKMYSDNCHVCHAAPCACTFTTIAALRT